MKFRRESGLLLHPTSLPGAYGMGEMGPAAWRFVDDLADMGQHLWQVLPLGPTSYGDSPYQSLSTFAGNHLLISFELLVRDGLLSERRIRDFPVFPEDAVDYGPVIEARNEVLKSVCRTFMRRATDKQKNAFQKFCKKHAGWLDDYALYSALKEAHGGRPWTEWDPAYARRDASALARAHVQYKVPIRNVKIQQYLFDDQWRRLRQRCRKHAIQIVGDIPIFVAHDSADVWSHPELYYLDEAGMPTVVAGVPPDYFSATGQLWGNPLYQWDVHKETGYAWWTARMKRTFELVDIVRIDHFRGFEQYWEVPAGEETAINGTWVAGPGADLFHVLREKLGELPIIAEDLGIITPEVEALRDELGFPGMRVLHFAFGNDPKADDYRPESYPENCVVYPGTHDNDTTVGWFRSESGNGSTRSHEEIERERRIILDYLGTDGSDIHWDLISLAMRSNADTSVVLLQDVLGLDSSARMNTPGKQGGNWQWRFRDGDLTPAIKQRMLELAQYTGRTHRA